MGPYPHKRLSDPNSTDVPLPLNDRKEGLPGHVCPSFQEEELIPGLGQEKGEWGGSRGAREGSPILAGLDASPN